MTPTILKWNTRQYGATDSVHALWRLLDRDYVSTSTGVGPKVYRPTAGRLVADPGDEFGDDPIRDVCEVVGWRVFR